MEQDPRCARPRRNDFESDSFLLPEKQRAAVLLHKYQELDYDEIARVLECSESALKSLLFRAYETLRVEAGATREPYGEGGSSAGRPQRAARLKWGAAVCIACLDELQ